MKRPLWLVLLVGMTCAMAASLWWTTGTRPELRLPGYAEVRASYRPSDVTLLDRNGEILQARRIDLQGRRLAWTPLVEISPALQTAVIAAEDRRFYRHHGVDVLALPGSMARRLTGQPLRGASTISMQLVTLIHPELRHRGTPRPIAQKWRQMQLAWKLERHWSKAEILEAYLNLVSYRGELPGNCRRGAWAIRQSAAWDF